MNFSLRQIAEQPRHAGHARRASGRPGPNIGQRWTPWKSAWRRPSSSPRFPSLYCFRLPALLAQPDPLGPREFKVQRARQVPPGPPGAGPDRCHGKCGSNRTDGSKRSDRGYRSDGSDRRDGGERSDRGNGSDGRDWGKRSDRGNGSDRRDWGKRSDGGHGSDGRNGGKWSDRGYRSDGRHGRRRRNRVRPAVCPLTAISSTKARKRSLLTRLSRSI